MPRRRARGIPLGWALPPLRPATAPAAEQAAAAAQETYTVQPGDTLGEIGARFGVDYHEIARVNGIENPDLIYPGQVFTIPR